MMASLEGCIDIALSNRAAGGVAAQVRSSRPQLAQRLLAGQAPQRVVGLVGMLFSLCGQAQRHAAALATRAASAQSTLNDATQGERLVITEMAVEHAWRLLLDWPTQRGHTAALEIIQQLRKKAGEPQVFATLLEETLTAALGGEPLEAWLEAVSAPDGLLAFEAWRQRRSSPLAKLFAELDGERDWGAAAYPFLPAVGRLEMNTLSGIARQALVEPEYCMQPQVAGAAVETGALARCQTEPLIAAWQNVHGAGIGARMLARLLELARLPGRLKTGETSVAVAWTLQGGVGAAAVDTSRGMLLHVVQLEAGVVGQYRIIAPTEWNFRAGGPLESALSQLPAGVDLLGLARETVLSMDPCVAYSVEWSNA